MRDCRCGCPWLGHDRIRGPWDTSCALCPSCRGYHPRPRHTLAAALGAAFGFLLIRRWWR